MNYRHALLIWVSLLGLLGISLISVALATGPFRYAINYGCAIGVGALIMTFYMRLRHADSLLRTFGVGGLLWLAFLLLLTFVEELTRT